MRDTISYETANNIISLNTYQFVTDMELKFAETVNIAIADGTEMVYKMLLNILNANEVYMSWILEFITL